MEPVSELSWSKPPTWKSDGNVSKGYSQTEHDSERFRELINTKLSNTSFLKKRQEISPLSLLSSIKPLTLWLKLLCTILEKKMIYLFSLLLDLSREPSQFLTPSDLCLSLSSISNDISFFKKILVLIFKCSINELKRKCTIPFIPVVIFPTPQLWSFIWA